MHELKISLGQTLLTFAKISDIFRIFCYCHTKGLHETSQFEKFLMSFKRITILYPLPPKDGIVQL